MTAVTPTLTTCRRNRASAWHRVLRACSLARAIPARSICWAQPNTHEYASDVLDAGTFARFGRVEIEPGSSGYEILTRSGNVEQPVRGWSDWQPLQDGSVASPAGRFLQWKAVLHIGRRPGPRRRNYLPVNSAPVIDELVVVPGARLNPQNRRLPEPNHQHHISLVRPKFDDLLRNQLNSSLPAIKDRTAVTVRWAAHDDDGDNLIYSLYLRGDGETVVASSRRRSTTRPTASTPH